VRKLAWAVGGLAVIGIIIVITVALSLNSLIDKNRDRILDQVRSALGRQVAADRIVVNLWGGFGARVDSVRIGDDPQFSDADFIQATAAVAVAEIWPLLHGQLQIRRVDLKDPRIHLIRDPSGRWNYESIGPSRTAAAPGSPQRAPSAEGRAHLLLALAAAQIENGSISVTDRTQDPARTTTIGQIRLTLSDLSETTPMSFDFQAAVSEDSRNVRIHGVVGPLTDPSAIPLRLDGSFGPLGPQNLRIDTLHVDAMVTPAALQVTHLDGRAFDGSFQLAGQLPLRSDAVMRLQGKLTNIAISQVLALFSADASKRVSGHGQVRMDLHATGASVGAVRSTLAGEVAADLHDATIKDFNIIREVLGRGSKLPVIGDLVSSGVKSQYEQMAATPDTRFQTFRATFQIAEQTLHTNDLEIEASDFGVRASGSITFSQEADLAGVLAMSPAFSRQVAGDVKEAKYLLDDQQRLALPFRLHGKLGTAKPQPDTNALLASLGQRLMSGGAKNLLMDLLGAAGQPAATPQAGQPQSGIEQGLRRLFGH
jgi:uncharacterized protein involved in outer membrane biogenesis